LKILAVPMNRGSPDSFGRGMRSLLRFKALLWLNAFWRGKRAIYEWKLDTRFLQAHIREKLEISSQLWHGKCDDVGQNRLIVQAD
jgi:hypothetical protein